MCLRLLGRFAPLARSNSRLAASPSILSKGHPSYPIGAFVYPIWLSTIVGQKTRAVASPRPDGLLFYDLTNALTLVKSQPPRNGVIRRAFLWRAWLAGGTARLKVCQRLAVKL